MADAKAESKDEYSHSDAKHSSGAKGGDKMDSSEAKGGSSVDGALLRQAISALYTKMQREIETFFESSTAFDNSTGEHSLEQMVSNRPSRQEATSNSQLTVCVGRRKPSRSTNGS